MRALALVAACGTAASLGPPTIPRLTAAVDSVVASGGVLLSADPVTNANWRQYSELQGRILTRVADTSSQWSELGNDSSAPSGTSFNGAPPGLKVRYEDFLLVPLPTFHVRISNLRKRSIDLSGARFRVEDDSGHSFRALDDFGLYDELERKFIFWRNHHENGIPAEQLSDLRAAARRLPIFLARGGVESGGDWSGYVSFHLESSQPIQHLVLVLEGLTAEGQPLGALRIPYVVQRRHAARACPDGNLASALGECKGDADETTPAADGPCIQKTRMLQSEKRPQWWIGGEPVADSDVTRTLRQRPSTKAALRRSLILRGLGYAMVGGGILLSGIAVVGIATNNRFGLAPAGLAFMSLSIAGIGVGYSGAARTEHAVRVYNEEADADGNCSVSW